MAAATALGALMGSARVAWWAADLRSGVSQRLVLDYSGVSPWVVVVGIALCGTLGWLLAAGLLRHWAARGHRSRFPKTIQVAALVSLIIFLSESAAFLRTAWVDSCW